MAFISSTLNLTNNYLPIPTREWSRLQACSFSTTSYDPSQTTVNGNEGTVTVPLTGKIVPTAALAAEMQMLAKGNVLQYKKNSSCITKNQRYAQIAKKKWATNATTSWATQSMSTGYTNPNTKSLQRTGIMSNVFIATGIQTDEAATNPCDAANSPSTDPSTANTDTVLPDQSSTHIDEKEDELPEPDTSGGSGATVLPEPVDPIPSPIPPIIIIPDGGSLICGTYENQCTGEVKAQVRIPSCNPASASDVPGASDEFLCWNDGIQPWYPRQTRIMPASGNKFPVNAILESAIRPTAPILNDPPERQCHSSLLVSWQSPSILETPIPIKYYAVFVNGDFALRVSSDETSAVVSVTNGAVNTIYVKSGNGNILSLPSNELSVLADIIELLPPTQLIGTYLGTTSAYLTWTPSTTNCAALSGYNIYATSALNGVTTMVFVAGQNTYSTIMYGLNDGPDSTYTFTMRSVVESTGEMSADSDAVTVVFPPVLTIDSSLSTGTIDEFYETGSSGELYYTVQFLSGTLVATLNYSINVNNVIGLGGGGGGGGGIYNIEQSLWEGGAGGGCGSITLLNNVNFQAGWIFKVVVGNGGTGHSGNLNGDAGGNTMIVDYATNGSVDSLIAGGGGGGAGQFGGSVGGVQGVVTSDTGVFTTATSTSNYTSGGGGDGYKYNSGNPIAPINGNSITSPATSITTMDGTVYMVGGGGGGGARNDSSSSTTGGGAAGSNGAGGTAGSQSTYTGQAALVNSGAGGGGGASSVMLQDVFGGNGGSGMVVMVFQVV